MDRNLNFLYLKETNLKFYFNLGGNRSFGLERIFLVYYFRVNGKMHQNQSYIYASPNSLSIKS